MVPWTLVHTLVAVPLYARERVYVQTVSYFFCFFVAWCGKMSEFLQMTSGTNRSLWVNLRYWQRKQWRGAHCGASFLSLKKSTASWKPDAQW